MSLNASQIKLCEIVSLWIVRKPRKRKRIADFCEKKKMARKEKGKIQPNISWWDALNVKNPRKLYFLIQQHIVKLELFYIFLNSVKYVDQTR